MGKTALISIHPKHIENILSGKKVFEYRKVSPKLEVSRLVLYSTAPVMKIVAVVEVLGCIKGPPTQVWNQTNAGSGISRQFFRDYFFGQKTATAFRLGKVYRMEAPMALCLLNGKKNPPQSFCYLQDESMNLIQSKLQKKPTNNSSMIFVGGVHGVGKSTICKKIFEPAGYKCVTASSLIATYKNINDRSKRVDQIADNQTIMLKQLSITQKAAPRLALDGHFTLINSNDQIEPIDIDVFRKIGAHRLILIKGEPIEIASRLKDRDGKTWNITFIEKFQRHEEEHACRVADELKVPLEIYDNNGSVDNLKKTVNWRFKI